MLEISIRDFIKSRRTKEVLNWSLALFISELVENLVSVTSEAANVKKKYAAFLESYLHLLMPICEDLLWKFSCFKPTQSELFDVWSNVTF